MTAGTTATDSVPSDSVPSDSVPADVAPIHTVDVDLSPAARLVALRAVERPTRRDEAWRYAPHRELAGLTFGPAAATVPVLPESLEERIPVLGGPRIVTVNGVVDRARSDFTTDDGLTLSTVAGAGIDVPELLRAQLERTVEDVADAYDALNAVFGADGAVVTLADGHELDVPIHVVDVVVPSVASGRNAEAGEQNAWCSGVVIHLGAGASATVVETRLGMGDEFGGSNTRTTITLGEGATLDHVVIQDVGPTQVHLGRVEVTQAARSDYRSTLFNLGSSYGRVAYDVHLDGQGARAELSGLFVGAGDQTLDQQVNVVHDAQDCTSRQLFRGVLDDASTGVFNGGIDVRPGAVGTDAEQSNDNLLLSTRAEVNTQPRLEILADDVACKHGATVGQLDESALYYLRSRGIPAEEARRLLVTGFVGQVIDAIATEAVRSWVSARVGSADG